ncbi:MAG: chemotaxis protein CheW [Planctomycetota bacterium]
MSVIEPTATALEEPIAARSRAGKYLTLRMGSETHGVDVLSIQEIIGVMAVTSVPQTPPFVKGVINLRGKVIPVIDLRLKFGMEEAEHTQETCIIVVNVSDTLMGIIVDTVNEVVDIEDGQIEDAPRFGSSVNTNFILGMGKLDGRVIILLEIKNILSHEELVMLESTSSSIGDVN